MGRPVMDIHAPSVASGAHANGDGQNGEKASVFDLMARKDELEAELSALESVLTSHGVNMNTGLTTFDGFPRSDIDVAQVRTTRAQIIRLQNDHKALMARIELALHDHFASNEASDRTSRSSSSPSVDTSTSATSQQNNRPFAKVKSVVASSPADIAGLRVDDIVTRFGDATWLNHDKLSRVAQVVSSNEGKQVSVTVVRVADGNAYLDLKLTPQRNWGGKGLLGCNLVPM